MIERSPTARFAPSADAASPADRFRHPARAAGPGPSMTVSGAPSASDAWRRFLRRGIITQAVCLLVAVFLRYGLGNDSPFALGWLYSALIGTCCWIAIDGSGLLIEHLRPDLHGEHAPGWLRLVSIGLRIAIGVPLAYTLGTRMADALTGQRSAPFWLDHSTLALSLLIAAAVSFFFVSGDRLRRERLAAEQAQRMATEAQLKLLESQLEPHMLFNTLANLRVLIGLDPARAQAMLDRLIAFLRATLSASRNTMHPLSAEFDRIADYLALMAIRMGPRLVVDLQLPADLRSEPVPPLMLQPLVENCIQHGLEPKVAGGRIEISASAQGGRLRITVRDTGVGLDAARSPAGRPGSGFGTQQVRERIAAVYGGDATFVLQAAEPPAEGTLAVVDVPLSQPRRPHP